jgi:hypothetical protein
VWADPSELSVRILGKYEYAEWANMRAHFAFNYPRDIHILIDLTWPESGIAFFTDMHCFQLPDSVKFLVAHLGPPYLVWCLIFRPRKITNVACQSNVPVKFSS